MISYRYRKPSKTKAKTNPDLDAVLKSRLYQELEECTKAGISLSFNGKPSDSLTIATHVREESDYMRDYQLDQNRQIKGIGFDRIQKKKY